MIPMISIRSLRPSDEVFIYSTMLRGLYYGNSWFSKIPRKLFVENYKKVIEHTFKRPDLDIKVACVKNDPDEIKGYSILLNHEKALMWVFVKKMWRKNGIAKALVPSTVQEVMNLTTLGDELLKKYPNIVFNPFV